MKESSANSATSQRTVSAPPLSFSNRVHDEFIKELHDKVKNEQGIAIQNIRIETLKIADEKLAHEMSHNALVSAQTNSKRANLDVQNMVSESEANQRAKLKRIEAEAEAFAAETKAQGLAKAKLIEAKAQAEATTLLAEAARKSAELQASNPLGEQLAIINAQAAAIGPNAKIITLPSGLGLQAFSMFARDNLPDTDAQLGAASRLEHKN